jgi:putative nucleotidyltransferase with HDIG domain
MPVEKTMEERFGQFKTLPTLPHILLKLIRVCSDDGESLVAVALIIETDPALGAKVIRLVNSAYYGLPNPVSSIDQAVSFLGVNTIKNIAVSASVHQVFESLESKACIDLQSFWRHCLKCAVIARLMAQRTGWVNADEAFLSGLLHDIGKLVLWQNFPEPYAQLVQTHGADPGAMVDAEAKLAMSHPEVSGQLIERWGLSSLMADAARYHHEPLSRVAGAFPLVQIVFAANQLSGPQAPQAEVFGAAATILKMSAEQVGLLAAQGDRKLAHAARSLGIDIESGAETDTMDGNQNAQRALTREVKSVSMLLGTLQNLLQAQGQPEILNCARQALGILFDLSQVLFFLHDAQKKALMGVSTQENGADAMLADLMVPMSAAGSLLVTSLGGQQPLSSFDLKPGLEPALLDAQLIRFCGKPGMLCLPMRIKNEPVGVIVTGLDPGQSQALSTHRRMLTLLVSHVASALYMERFRQSRQDAIVAERAAATTLLARKVVHEVNNPLGIIKNYLSIMGIKLADQAHVVDEIRIIGEEIERISQILTALTSASKDTGPALETVSLNELIKDLQRLMAPSLASSETTLVLNLAKALPPVLAERDGLKQILINLVKNASEAMIQKGQVTVNTRRIATEISTDAFQGLAELIVEDNGPGIAPEIRSRLFEPFVSSKGGHSGLGLSIVFNLIKRFNGSISCDSSPGKGTRFIITLPLAGGAAPGGQSR